MSLQIPNLPEGVSGSQVGSATTGTSAQASLATTAKVALIRLPEQVMQLSPMTGSGLPGDLYVKMPEGLSVSATAQHSLSRGADLPPGQAALVETATRTQHLSLDSLTKLQLHDIVAKALSADGASAGVALKAMVTQVSANTLSVRLDLPGKPLIEVPFPSRGRIAVGDAVTLTVQPAAKNLWTVQISATNTGSSAGTVRVNGDHKLIDLAVLQQLKQGLSVQGQPAADLVAKLPVSGTSAGHVTAASLTITAGQLKLTQAVSQTLGKISLPEAIQLPLTSLASGSAKAPLLESVNDASARSDVKLPALDPLKGKQVQEHIVQLSRQLLSETGSTRQALQQLVQGLNQPDIPLSASSQALLKLIHDKINLGVVNTGAINPQSDAGVSASSGEAGTRASSIQGMQALFSSLAQPLTPASLVNPQSPSSFLNGLITLLQVTLAGRAIRQQPGLAKAADDPASFLSKTIAATPTGGTPSRVSLDFARMDAQNQIVAQIKTLLANHQQQKLTNADTRIQGQDNFYFVLPVNQEKQAPPEVLIRREESGQQEAGGNASATRQWHLTMKLDIDELGQLLVKSRITAETLDLNIYTSTDPLLYKVADTLPFLLKRFSALGLTVESSSFQRGKIPESLAQKPYQLFETRV